MLGVHLKIGLKLKIALAFVFFVLVMMATVTYIFTIRQQRISIYEVQLRMERLAKNIATIRAVETQDWTVYQNYIENQLPLNPDIVYIAIEDDQGQLKSHALNTDWLLLDNIAPPTQQQRENMVRRLIGRQVTESSQRDLESKSVNIMLGGRNSGTVKVGFSLVTLNDALRANLIRNLVLGLIFSLLGIWIALTMSRRILDPLSKLTNAMNRITQGDLDQEIEIASKDELGRMADTFNFMVHGLREKKMIEDFSRELGSDLELRTVSRMIRDRITYALRAKRGIILLRDQSHDCEFALTDVDESNNTQAAAIKCNSDLYKNFNENPTPQTLGSLKNHKTFYRQINSLFSLPDRALITPMKMHSDCLGLFILEPDSDDIITANEQAFLMTLITQGVMAIENALLLEELTEQERLKRELEIARTVQMSLLPSSNPSNARLDIDGRCLPAMEVGGDYFDFFELDEDKIGVVIADVTGKGTSAAFYMAVVKGILITLAQTIHSPGTVLSELNRRLWGQMDRKVFVTMIYAVLNTKTGHCQFARAGHNGLVVQRAGNIEIDCYAPNGIGLGLEKGPVFEETIEEQEFSLNSGDRLLLYTDGAFEARNDTLEEFGEERLMQLFSETNGEGSGNVNQTILDKLSEFISGSAPHDDITLITVTAK